jgi:hypothetical protein
VTARFARLSAGPPAFARISQHDKCIDCDEGVNSTVYKGRQHSEIVLPLDTVTVGGPLTACSLGGSYSSWCIAIHSSTGQTDVSYATSECAIKILYRAVSGTQALYVDGTVRYKWQVPGTILASR